MRYYPGDPFGFILPNEKPLIMLYLQSYFDESGTIEKDRLLSFCGWVGSNANWEVCYQKWTTALGSLGLKYFKANEAFHYTKALSARCPAIGVDNRVKALSALVNSIRNSIPLSVSVVMDCAAFRSLPESDRKLIGGGDPTFYAFLQALTLIQKSLGAVTTDADPRVSIVCDETHKYAHQYLEAWHRARQVKPELRKTFVSIGFADDTYFEQLQVADFLASVMRREADRRFNGAPFDMNRMYDLLTDASDTNTGGTAFMGRDVLLKLIENRKRRSAEKRQGKLKSK